MDTRIKTHALALLLEWCCEWLGEEAKNPTGPADQLSIERVRKLARQRVAELEGANV